VSAPGRSLASAGLVLATLLIVSACSTTVGGTSGESPGSPIAAGSPLASAPGIVPTSPASPAAAAVTKVQPAEAVSMLAGRTVIDVRTPAEYATGHVAGAIDIDVESTTFDSQIASLDKDAAYLVYCHSGRRSALAAARMAAAGFTDVVDGGGIDGLVAAGAPTE
jgi:phage shock protein E